MCNGRKTPTFRRSSIDMMFVFSNVAKNQRVNFLFKVGTVHNFIFQKSSICSYCSIDKKLTRNCNFAPIYPCDPELAVVEGKCSCPTRTDL